MPSIKGTASVEDSRALSKALKSTKFPATFKEKIDATKLNRPIFVQWIEGSITRLLGFEDEIVQLTAVNLFLPEQSEESNMAPIIDPRKAQIDLAGFLGDENAATFCAELWDMMLDAAQQPLGIPRKLLEEKKKELAAAQKAKDEQRQSTLVVAPPLNQYQQQQHQPRHQANGHNDGPRQRPLQYERREHRRDVSPLRGVQDSSRGRRDDRNRGGSDGHFEQRHTSGVGSGEFDEYGRRRAPPLGSRGSGVDGGPRSYEAQPQQRDRREHRPPPSRRRYHSSDHRRRDNHDRRRDEDRYSGSGRRDREDQHLRRGSRSHSRSPRRGSHSRSRSPPPPPRRSSSRRERSYSSSSSSSTGSFSSRSSSSGRRR